jgi:N-acetyl-gamma-glutamyl-phosphate reductase
MGWRARASASSTQNDSTESLCYSGKDPVLPFFIAGGHRMKAAIVGATGYTGLELYRILLRHPGVTITALTSERYAGSAYSSVFPSLLHTRTLQLESLRQEAIADKADIIFTALPHSEAMRVVPYFCSRDKYVIDLSADFRLSSSETYQRWYQPHIAPELLGRAVYGLPELNRSAIAAARLVANPGCYPTSIILPLYPFIRGGLISLSGIIADSKSGVSGAGRALKVPSLFCETSESCKAYGLLSHRHTPEIEEQLSRIASHDVSITFSPHLVPINRGMLSTIYLTLNHPMDSDAIHTVLLDCYGKERFIRVLPPGTLPETGWVRGTNFCDIGFRVDGCRLILVSAIDNLTRGASGQAVQNMNIMLGLPEDSALDQVPLYP